jgi:hypothetical protein
MALHFTVPLYPAVTGLQSPSEWPEIDAKTVEQFNAWLRHEIQAEIKRRASVPDDASESMSGSYGDEIWFAHMRAAAILEMVKLARANRGKSISVDLYGGLGYRGGMRLG